MQGLILSEHIQCCLAVPQYKQADMQSDPRCGPSQIALLRYFYLPALWWTGWAKVSIPTQNHPKQVMDYDFRPCLHLCLSLPESDLFLLDSFTNILSKLTFLEGLSSIWHRPTMPMTLSAQRFQSVSTQPRQHKRYTPSLNSRRCINPHQLGSSSECGKCTSNPTSFFSHSKKKKVVLIAWCKWNKSQKRKV